jgi:hypothetical protein
MGQGVCLRVIACKSEAMGSYLAMWQVFETTSVNYL